MIDYLGFFRFVNFFVEDSMNEIRHQAMIELQKLVLAAENKMIELVAAERTKMSGNCRSSAAAASLQISPSLISQYNVSRVQFVGSKSVCSDETTILCYALVTIIHIITLITGLSCPSSIPKK